MPEEIELGKVRTHLGTAFLGNKIKEEILQNFDQSEKIILNFTGVETISESFAYECFHKLVLEKSKELVLQKIDIKGANPFIKAIINKAVEKKI